MKGKAILIIYSAILSILVIVLSHNFQQQISYNDGLGWDGVKYNQISNQVSSNEQISTKAPFVYRIGVPWLVAKLFPNDNINGYLMINWVATVINAILLAILLSMFTKKRWIVYLLVAIYVTQWHSYHRFGSFYPVQVDSLAITLLLLSIIILLRKSISVLDIIAIAFITLVGATIREILVIPTILLFAKFIQFNPFDKTSYKNIRLTTRFENTSTNIYYVITPFLIFFAVTILVRLSVEPTNSYKFYNAAADALYTKSIFRFFHSWIVSYGAILILPALFYKNSVTFLKQNPILAIYLLIIIAISYVGGADTERLAYWSFPAVFLLVANVLDKIDFNKSAYYFISVILVLQIFSQRLFWTIPDFPGDCDKTIVFLTPVGNCFPYLNLFPAHSELIPAIVGFAEWSILILILYIWKRKINIEINDNHSN